MLHLLGFPGDRNDLLDLLLATLNDGDAVVLLDEGLPWADDEAAMAALRNKAGISVYLLDAGAPTAGTAVITAIDLVTLSEQHPACSSWYP